ncbi:MAG: rhodanese-like domain-containing protein [Terrimicrobiaceae bacterium]
MAELSTILPPELQRVLSSDPHAQLLDVRTPSEFHEVHVPQASNYPLGSLDVSRLEREGHVSRGGPVYLLCRSGQRATTAAEKFISAGFDKVVVVEGGTLAWIDAKLPVNRGKNHAIGLERQVRIAAGSLVLTGVVLGFLLNPAFFLLSGFVGAGLIFAGITDWCGMGILLAKAPWNTR